jgi:predicted nucleotidyltransferase
VNVDEKNRLTAFLKNRREVSAAWVFGSVARGESRTDSDLDVAVLGPDPLSAADKQSLIEDLAVAFGRPVDVIDLNATHGPIVGRVLHDGTRLFCEDTTLHAMLLKRWWLYQADWMPYRRRILKERRERWIED